MIIFYLESFYSQYVNRVDVRQFEAAFLILPNGGPTMAVWDLPPNKLLSPFNVHLSPSINIPHHTHAFIALLQEAKKQCGKKSTPDSHKSKGLPLILWPECHVPGVKRIRDPTNSQMKPCLTEFLCVKSTLSHFPYLQIIFS